MINMVFSDDKDSVYCLVFCVGELNSFFIFGEFFFFSQDLPLFFINF